MHTGIALMLHNELWSTSVGGKLITRFPGFPLKCRGNRQSIIIGIAHFKPLSLTTVVQDGGTMKYFFYVLRSDVYEIVNFYFILFFLYTGHHSKKTSLQIQIIIIILIISTDVNTCSYFSFFSMCLNCMCWHCSWLQYSPGYIFSGGNENEIIMLIYCAGCTIWHNK